ncbi:MAG: signal peptide peptidase SppA [Alphaproteobacteria bacterium]|nr:signal peptide peptidase SppA [Alphaproteobacteria bacterium]
MLRFITRFFAVIGFFATLSLVLSGVALYIQERAVEPPENIVLVLDFDQPIVERVESSPFDLAMHEESAPLLGILRAIDKAKSDPHVKGIVARFGGAQPSLTQAQAIRAALARFRTSGKFTYAFASSYGGFGGGNRAYYLASAFEQIWLQPVGAVGLSGLMLEAPFARTALEKIGVKGDFLQREEYKSVMDVATQDGFTPPVRSMMQGMIEDFADQIASGIAESRKWDKAKVRQLMGDGPYTAEEALKAGLVTRIGYADELNKELDKTAGKDAEHVSVETYLGYAHKAADKAKTHVALIYGTGLITDRDGGPAGLSGEHIMAADKLAEAFDNAASDSDIKAILFRIDSPGGSPEASETIRRALVHAQGKGKPVIVSMGDVAASGGYWVAMNADHIIAEAGTLTGSIGVVAGKFVLGGLMQKLGVSWDSLKTTENAGMFSVTEGFSPAQRARMNALLDETYRTFVKNVSDARKIPMDKMPAIAKGRVWTGAQAVKIGLVDELGGYDVALKALRKKLNLDEKEPILFETFPAPLTPAEKALKLLKGFGIESAMIRAALSQWQVVQVSLGPLWSRAAGFDRPVMARMPAFDAKSVR